MGVVRSKRYNEMRLGTRKRIKIPFEKGSRLYKIWSDMKSRCDNQKDKDYPNYGGRGISYSRRWNIFMNFARWALGNGYQEDLTIDRIDTNGNYCPENCRWLDMKAQSNNRRTNVVVAYKGEEKTIKEWSETMGLPYQTVYARIQRYGWSIEKALETPV